MNITKSNKSEERMSDKNSESFERIMNMTIHTLDETSMDNVSKMWVYIEEQQQKLQAAEERERILREALKDIAKQDSYTGAFAQTTLEQVLEKVASNKAGGKDGAR